MKKLIDYLKRLKSQLFTAPSGKSLSRWILTLILILDFQILYFVIDGAKSAANYIEHPENPVPQFCHILFYQYKSSSDEAKFQYIEGLDQMDYYYDSRLIASGCQKAQDLITNIKTSQLFQSSIKQLTHLRQNISNEEENISNLKSTYDTALLEKAAGQSQEDSILKSGAGQIKSEIQKSQAKINQLKAQLDQVSLELISQDQVVKLIQLSDNSELKTDMDLKTKEYFWQLNLRPIKRLFASLLFLFPILILALFWNSYAHRKQSATQIMASTHLLVISILPIFLKISYFIYELLPDAFFTQFFNFLLMFRISFIWNYFVIIFTIIFFGLLFWGSQKLLNNPLRRRRNQILKHECMACDEVLENNSVRYCYFCGQDQFTECKSCHQLVNAKFHNCSLCGSKL